MEEAVELDLSFVNPSMASLVAHCNDEHIPVVLVSDMYLGERRVRGLLARAGFDAARHTNRVIVSVDAGGYKMTGFLYTRLKALYPDVRPDEMLHIGDNIRSDVAAARAGGLHAVHYDVVRHDPDATLALEALVVGNGLPELDSVRRLAGSLAGGHAPDARAWYRTGAQVVGPFLAALVEWTLDQAVAHRITLVAPLMREGHLLAPMLRRAAEARGLDVAVEPLYVSRQAVALAGVRDAATELVGKLFEGRRHFTIADLFALVDTPVPSEIAEHAGAETSSADRIHVATGASLRTWIASYLSSSWLQPDMQRVIEAERRRLVGYLDQALGAHQAVATLDIGFFGNIQRSLSTALELEGRNVALTHLLAFGHGPVQNDVLNGIEVRTFAGGYGASRDLVKTIHRSAPVIEQLLQGPEGSTTGYETRDGGSVAIREANPLPAHDLRHKAIVQDGVRDFHELWLHLGRTNPSTTEALVGRREAWCQLVHRFIAAPSHGEASRIGSLHDDVNFGSRAVQPFCPSWSDAHVAWTGAESAFRQGPAALPVVWPHGVITRVDPGAIVKRYAEASPIPYVSITFALAHQLRLRGITRVIGYGTGDVAAAFIDAAGLLGLHVAGLVDSNADRHGQSVRDVAILSLEAALGLGVHTYVVLSVAHVAPIGHTIRRRYGSEPVVPLVFDLLNQGPTQ